MSETDPIHSALVSIQFLRNDRVEDEDALMIEVLDILKTQKPYLAPLQVWQVYEQVEQVSVKNPISELVALVTLLQRVSGVDTTLTNYEATVNRNFQEWVFRKQAGALKFSEE